jgi:2-polyprenyl-3-methyl-5-hydroxy-6-metoxy-1,4-benzoquinol methylase
MALQIYERLSRVYDLDWGEFSARYFHFLQELLAERRLTQAKILDLGCGTGILAAELARNGHKVTGIDISRKMIERAIMKSAGMYNLRFQVGDMREFNSEKDLDVILCTGNAINYVTNTLHMINMLNRIRCHLRMRGFFVFDTVTEPYFLTNGNSTSERKMNEETFVQSVEYKESRKTAFLTYEFPDGVSETHTLRPWTVSELKGFMARARLRVVAEFSDFDRRPVTPESERIICVAQKITRK